MLICKLCFRPFVVKHMFHLLSSPGLCQPCYQRLEWHHQINSFHRFKLESLFDYGEHFQSLIHQFKTNFDVELGKVFLDQHRVYLRIIYRGYTLVPAPSHALDTMQRGFFPLGEIWQQVGLPMLDVFEKNQPYRQADQGYEERKKIHNIVVRKPNIPLPKKILLVDDVMTSGETLYAMIRQLLPLEQNHLKIFVLARKKVEKNEITTKQKNDKIVTWKQQLWHGLKNSLNSKKNI